MKQIITIILTLYVVNVDAQNEPKLTVKEILTGKFKQNYIYGLFSMKDGIHYTSLEKDGIVKYSYETGEKISNILLNTNLKDSIKIKNYQFSNDEQKILIATQIDHIYRHSTIEHNYIYYVENKTFEQISKEGKQQYATFSPDGNKIAYVRKNNIYIYDIESKTHTQITEDGEKNVIINGALDWVYEEEFDFTKAFFWSSNAKEIAYYKFKELNIKEYSMQIWNDYLYPENYKYKYPKAGEKNSIVEIWVYNLTSKESRKIATTDEKYEYIPRIKWTQDSNIIAIQMMNRHQNELDIYFVNTKTNDKEKIYFEKQTKYIDITDNWTFTPKNKYMLITSDKNGYNHIYRLNLNNKQEVQITDGEWEIINFYGYNYKTDEIFYSSTETTPMDRTIYKINLDGSNKIQLTQKKGWSSADFSNGMKYFINTYSTLNTPNIITLYNSNGEKIRELGNSQSLIKKLEKYNFPKKEFVKIFLSNNLNLNASILKPQNINPYKKHPVLFIIYGGPGSQKVKNKWSGSSYMWEQLLAQKGYITISVDNRGTGGRGAIFKKATYKQLGNLELDDYIETAKYLVKLGYIDENRIGIWGWSYGGFMSCMAITKGADVFKTAIAVAPVINWRFYDNIYTERYMQTPQENEKGYDENTPMQYVNNLKGNLLLVHGTGDDNVHIQNTYKFINALIEANKHYDLLIYPDRNHSIYGGNTRVHLYEEMTNYILNKL